MSEAENFLLPEQVVWGLVGAKVRLPRSTNCANAPFGMIFDHFIHHPVWPKTDRLGPQ